MKAPVLHPLLPSTVYLCSRLSWGYNSLIHWDGEQDYVTVSLGTHALLWTIILKNPIAGSRNAQSHFLTSSSRTPSSCWGSWAHGQALPGSPCHQPSDCSEKWRQNCSLGHEIFLMAWLRVQVVLLHCLLFLAYTQSEKQNYLCLNTVISMAVTCRGLNGQGLNFSFTSRITLWSLCNNKFLIKRILWTHSGNIHAKIVSLANHWIL